MTTKQDIINAAKGTPAEAFIARVMAAHPEYQYQYTTGISKVERTTRTILINYLNKGDALIGAAVHELVHPSSPTYAAYVADANRAVNSRSFDMMATAIVTNGARTIAAAMSIADPNKYTTGYISVDQANAALASARSIASADSATYQAALASEISKYIRQNSEVIDAINQTAALHLKKQTGLSFLIPPPAIPPLERITIDKVDIQSYLDALDGPDFSVEVPGGTYDQFGNWFSWTEEFLNDSVGDVVDDIFNDYGSILDDEAVTYEVQQTVDGDWSIGFSSRSERLYSPLQERISEIGKPHGIESFLKWFQQRTEEMARDVIIVNSTTPTLDNQATQYISTPTKLIIESAPSQLPPDRTATAIPALPSDITLSTSGLIESMAQWAPSASDGDSFANSAPLRGQARWSDLAPAV